MIDIFPWHHHFDTGLPAIDRQHRQLVQLVNTLAGKMAVGAEGELLNAVLDELVEYSEYHFETEEAIWREFLDGDVSEADHNSTHEIFVQEIACLKNAQNNKPLTELVQDALAFLVRWLASHILELDRYMAYIVLARQQGLSIDAAKRRAQEQMEGAAEVLIDIILTIYSTLAINTLNLMRELAQREKIQTALLHESEKNLALLHNGSDGIHILDLDGNVIEASDAFCDMLGYPREEVIGMNVARWDAKFAPADLPKLIRQQYAGPKRIQFETIHRRKDGHLIHVEVSGCSLKFGNDPMIYYAARDISERKRMETELRQSEQRFHDLFNSSPDPVWIIDNHRFVECNQAAVDMLGYPDKESLKHTHPSELSPNSQPDGESSFSKAERMMNIAQEEGLNRFEWVHQRRDGSHFYAEVTLSTILLQGRSVIHCSWRDISARKKAEESLRLAMLVYQNTSEAIMVTETDGIIIAVNPAFISTTGYSQEEAVGQTPSILSSGKHDQAYYRDLWESLNMTGQWRGEIINRRKNGEHYVGQLAISTIFREDGSPWRHVALCSDITEQKASEEQLWKQANFDTLTGLPNRRMFYDRLAQELMKSNRTGLPMALLFLDIDRFKDVNDTLGHSLGDALLQEAADRLVACVRGSDTVARLGGDEFTVIIGGLSGLENLNNIAEKILTTLRKPYIMGTETAYLSASLGITFYPNDASEQEQLVKNADQAMYAAKSLGRNRYCYFTLAMQEAAENRLHLSNDLRHALAQNQFELYYQPIVDLETDKVCKAEALIRWHHPSKGLISPDHFIPLAEESGLIHEIGNWVFQQSIEQLKIWRETFDPHFQISVNKSPVQFRDSNPCQLDWSTWLKSQGLPCECLVVEITEGLLLDGQESTHQKLLQFRDHGVQVAIDDFGTGYSALSYLQKFDIDYLKIDRSFTQNLTADSNDLALCEAIIMMAHKLGLQVIAEGIETAEQRRLLEQIGCDYGQGYLFAKPLPVGMFSAYLKAFLQTN